MKNLGAKLKGLDYKMLLVDHAEKMVLGVVVLCIMVALLKTSWSSYEKQPRELSTMADKSLNEVLAGKWPDEMRQSFAAPEDIRLKVRRLMDPIDVSVWEYRGTTPSYPLYRRQEPISEPEWLAIEDLIVSAGVFLAELLPDPLEGEDGDGLLVAGEDADKDGAVVDNRLVPRGGGGGDPRLAARNGAAGPGLPGAPGPGVGLGLASPDPAAAGGIADFAGGMVGGSMMMGSGTVVNARGLRYASIRGVYPLRKQAQKILSALHGAVTPQSIDQLVEILDFKLERQTAKAETDAWAGAWEEVDIQVALDLLDEVADFDPDVIDSGITDSVITMPLARRVVGYWGDDATHFRVKNFQLSQEEIAQETRINQKYIEAEQRREQSMGRRKQEKRAGFAETQHAIRDIRQNMMGDMAGMNQFWSEFQTEMDPNDQNRNAFNQMKDRVTASGRLLLFRYFDFAIEPGNAYRYRVKVKLRNPNYLRGYDEVVDQSVADGETRDTPWSQPSNTVMIGDDVKFFLGKVSPARGSRVFPSVNMNVFQWYSDAGTTINGSLKTSYGQMIGGLSKADVLRPAKQTFEEEDDVEFSTGRVLVDLYSAPKIIIDEHPDLQISSRSRGYVGIVDQALVVNRYGELVAVDPVSSSKERRLAENRYERERKPFEFLKGKAAAAEGPGGLGLEAMLDPAMAGAAGMMPAMMEGMQAGRRGRRNPLRRKTSNRRGSAAPGAVAP